MLSKKLILATLLVLYAETVWSKGLCFRGKPLPDCKTFFVTEFSVASRIAGSRGTGFETGLDKLLFSLDYGLMRNITQRYALGGTFFVDWNLANSSDTYFDYGVKSRLRYWMKNRMSVDFSPGLILGTGASEIITPGFTGSLSLNFKDLVALTGSLEIVRTRYFIYPADPFQSPEEKRKSVTSFYLGAKAQGLPGVIASAAGAAGLLVFIGIAIASGGFGD